MRGSTSTLSVKRPEVHGHRGCRGLRPENTLPAFLHAIVIGVDVLELDVVLSADGQLVVSHEPWMNSLICLDPQGQHIAPDEELLHNLYQLPYDTIRRYDCGQLRHPAYPEQQSVPAHKPLLREVVARVDALSQQLNQGLVRFSIEVKSTPAGDGIWHPTPEVFVEIVAEQLQLLGLMFRTTLLSFDKRILRTARRSLLGLPLCLLVEDTIPFEQHLSELGFKPAVYGPHHELVTEALVAQTRQFGVALVPWTVNELAHMHRLVQMNVKGLTTDYPDRLLHLLSSADQA
ncbi:glycerophosphodiester phosphodiesterase family protein [uncultured Hymenobacter sp.]|uniref:glycerophosphodiester phosphodiesterase family protein n=1 Tax=uncultured Hymenobacter sp. TaxID=170016 RepID=UPI0035CB34A4